jgi:hypothetical protein
VALLGLAAGFCGLFLFLYFVLALLSELVGPAYVVCVSVSSSREPVLIYYYKK